MFYAVYLCISCAFALFPSCSFSLIKKEKYRNFFIKVYFLCRKIADIDFFAYICNVILIDAMSK